jgi:hypothetical protein
MIGEIRTKGGYKSQRLLRARDLEEGSEFALGSCHFFFGRLRHAVMRPPNTNARLQSPVCDQIRVCQRLAGERAPARSLIQPA